MWTLLVVLLLAPTIIFVLAFVLSSIAAACYPRPCPECGHPNLKQVSFTRATVMVEGKRMPDSWTIYACEGCGARFKHDRGGFRRDENESI